MFSFWQNRKFRALVYQVIACLAIIYSGYTIFQNTLTNLGKRGISSGFGFLTNNSGFPIIQSLIPYDELSSYGAVFLVGLLNTLLVSVIGVFIATIIGFIVGIARVSQNWLIQKLSAVYVEIFRNVPLLLQIFFWYHAVLKPLPAPRQLYEKGDAIAFGINNRGIYVPEPVYENGFIYIVLVLLIALVASFFIKRNVSRTQMMTGKRKNTTALILSLILGLPLLTAFLVTIVRGSFPLSFDYAVMGNFQLLGGISIIPEFIALLIALSVYTASFIAEIVKSGLLSVDKGQTEAATSLGLKQNTILRLIIIPQAMRVIIPPLTSQYLNLTKNSSLAAAIAYPDLVSIFTGTVLNQTGQAVEIIAITMLVYLLISLVTSFALNWYNAKVSTTER